MNYLIKHTIDCLNSRIVELQDRLAHETDPRRRDGLQTEIARDRRDLALLFLKENAPDQGREVFYVRRDEHGTLNLHLRHARLPVNPAYLEHLLGELKITVPEKGLSVVRPAFAQDAIEEAVAQVNHDLAVSGDLRRRLAFFHRIAETVTSEKEDEKACA